MKIGTVSGFDYENGGAAHVKYDIWRALKKEHEMVLYSFTKHNNGIIPNKSIIPWRTYRLTMLQWSSGSMVARLARNCDLLLYLEGVVGFPNGGGVDRPIIIYNHSGFRQSGFAKPSGIRKLYFNMLESKFEQNKERIKSDKKIHILTNSKYTAGLIREDVGRDATIIYPGVDISGFKPTNESSRHHRSGVVSVGTFNLDKNYDKICVVMEKLDVPYTIMGYARYPEELKHYAMLKKKYPNVRLIPNPSISEMKEQLHKSKVYLHGKVEDFGISVVEAIAAGCVPIAMDAGGLKETVPINELRYTSMGEIANMILKAVSGHYDCHLPHLQKHVESYDTPVFDEAIRKFVRGLSV